jgi:hypothetical protein
MYGLFTLTTAKAFKGKKKVVPSIRSSRRGLNVINALVNILSTHFDCSNRMIAV